MHRQLEAINWTKSLPMQIIYVPGNHEYSGSSLPATDRLLGELSQGCNVTLLNCPEHGIGKLRVLGALS